MRNKKNMIAVLSVLLAMAVVLASFAAPTFAKRKLGDVDGNGVIESADARLALRASVRLENLSTEQMMAADVDSNGEVESADARLILRASVSLEQLPDIEVGEEEPTGEAPMTDPTSEPETTTVPEPETTTVPEPETTTVPEPETTTVPEPETTTVPEPETTTVPEPETTTAPEPETTTVPEPETTTVPEPETTTVPEPETTTVPEPTTDPSEGFITPEKDNEFDILRSGTYYFIGDTVEASERSELQVARTSNSLYMSADFNGAEVGIMKVGNKSYLVAPDKGAYLDLNTLAMKAQMKLIGVDMDEMFATNAFDFSIFPPLENASRSERQTDDPTCVKYVFETAKGSVNVTMRGKTLVCLENAQNGSVYRIEFKSVTGDVPSQKREVKNLKKVNELVFISYMTGN